MLESLGIDCPGQSDLGKVIMPEWLLRLLESGAVWTALIALLNIIVKYLIPTMPAEILVAINVLVVAILAALGINVSSRVRSYRATH